MSGGRGFLPGAQVCTRNLIGADSSVFVLELLLTGRCGGLEALCGPCPVLSRNARAMRLPVAEEAVRTHVRRAAAEGFSRLHVQLVGGDPLCAFETLSALTESLGSWADDFPVNLGFTTCGGPAGPVDPLVRDWLLQNGDRLLCSFRWNGAEGTRRWRADRELWNRIVRTVLWSVRPDTLDEMGTELKELLAAGVRVMLEYPAPESWRLADAERYVEALRQLTPQEARVLWGNVPDGCRCAAAGAVLVDIGGKTYPCRLLSPERMTYSQLQQRFCPAGSSGEGELCPAEQSLSRIRLFSLLDKLHRSRLGQFSGV